jgi:DNA polymerase III epsilon subunit-like protein
MSSSSSDSDSDNELTKKHRSRLVTKRVGSEMVIFDIEGTGLNNPIQPIEFGALVINKLTHRLLIRFSRLIRPTVRIEAAATAIHGLKAANVASKPIFKGVAQSIYEILNGRIWVGHYIEGYDIPVLRQAFREAGMAMPKPSAIIDTLPLFRERFGYRAGDCKLATLADYFQVHGGEHRALADCATTLKVLKHIGMSSMLETANPKAFAGCYNGGDDSDSDNDIYDSDNEFFVGHGSR